MFYQHAFNKEMCAAEFVIEHNYLSKTVAKQQSTDLWSELHLICLVQSGNMYKASEKLSQRNKNKSLIIRQRKLFPMNFQ